MLKTSPLTQGSFSKGQLYALIIAVLLAIAVIVSLIPCGYICDKLAYDKYSQKHLRIMPLLDGEILSEQNRELNFD